MRTSLTETAQIEAHVLQRSDPGDELVFEARLLLEPTLAEKVEWQKEAYRMIKIYGRRQLKKKLKAYTENCSAKKQHKSFSQKIRSFFLKTITL